MKESVIDPGTVLELFNLDEDRVESFKYNNINGDAVLSVRLKRVDEPCPRCHCPTPNVKEYQTKAINYTILTDRKCDLAYDARRFICPVCNRTYFETNPFVFKKQKISTMTVVNILKALKKPGETFTTVAEENHISPTSAASIFDQHVKMDRLTLTERINMDECYAFSGEEGKYVLMILDDITGDPIDILPSRRKDYLIDYFLKIPLEERQKVKYVSTDMYETYRQVVHQVMENALVCADAFHVSKEIHTKMEKVRVRVMNRYAERDRQAKKEKKMKKGESSDEYYLLKYFHWLLYKKSDAKDKNGNLLLDPKAVGKYNKHFKKVMNFAQLLDLILSIDEELTEAYNLKNEFNDFYAVNTYDTAETALRKLIKAFRNSNIKEMKECGTTLANWSREIINSFIVVDNEYEVEKDTGEVTVHQKHMNSATIERKNGILKLIKKAGCGYRNWTRFRNRCLYVLRENASFQLEPIDEPKAQKAYRKKGKSNA